MQAAQIDPLLGAVVDGRYEVVGVLGEGGMGRVYEVRHAALGRAFALKVLRPDLAREDGLAERFIHEAKATARVEHPSVVHITDFGRLPDGAPYFVMELLVGRTLGEIIKEGGPVPVARAVRIARKVAGALGAAHDAGVVHRDLKPDNVFVVEGGAANDASGADVKVVDFGAAKIAGSSRMTRAGVIFGTPHYMSPEQASGQPVDRRSDVYALGVIMYEMFTGRAPFEAETYMGVLTQHMFVQPEAPSRVSEAARDLGALEGVTLRCLAKRPDDRFASMVDLIDAIDAAVRAPAGESRGEPAALAGEGDGGPGAQASSAPIHRVSELDDTHPADAEPRGEGPPLPLLWAAAGAAAIAIVLLGARLLSRRDPPPPSASTTASASALASASASASAPPSPAPFSHER